MPESADWLLTRRVERAAILRRVTSIMRDDPRVETAWLSGSLGAGRSDDLSDIDLWVVVEDAHLPALVANRHAFVAQIGPPVLIQEAPLHAPAGGAYLLVLYPGQAGPHQVDWYWQPRTGAQIPPQAWAIFDRAGLSVADTPRLTIDEVMSRLSHLVATFWAMSFITAKKIYREEGWTAVKMLSAMRLEVDEIQALLDDQWAGTPYSDRRSGVLPIDAVAQLQELWDLGSEVKNLMPEVELRGAHVPWAAVAQVEAFMAIVGRALSEQGHR